MIDIQQILKQFNGRFKNSQPVLFNHNSLLPHYHMIDTLDNEKFIINIDSLANDPEIIIKQTLTNKIINKRNNKINQIIK